MGVPASASLDLLDWAGSTVRIHPPRRPLPKRTLAYGPG
jgi:hypothetical protein